MIRKKIFMCIFCIISISVVSQTWTNPFTLVGEWFNYGIGDPYILKYRGTYYLYASTKDNNIGVKCWSSIDLIKWSDAITCSTDEITKTAYAPEVVYWNGMFYMYTSPSGGGHYVLSSTSPTGPFTTIAGNLGKNIDGSVFINDDGKWYFYHANNKGIQGCLMSSPTAIGASVNLNAQIGSTWTEGPCVFKRNAKYYLTYTGNHVISKGYRTNYATNSTGPISTFTPQDAQNPILVNSEGNFVGLGHGSVFVGPDLDSYYFTYHNLAGDFGVGPYRRFNYDRIAWNGDKLVILGPTTWAQQAPQLADLSDYFNRTTIGTNWFMPNGGNWGITNLDFMYQNNSSEITETWYKAINSRPTTSNYTAEFTIKEVLRNNIAGKLGAVFGYTDESNYGIALFNSHTNQLEINFRINNSWGTPKLISLPTEFNYTCWHSIRVEKYETNYNFFVDGMLKATLTSNLGGGKVGYMTSWCQGNFSYIAFSNKVNGSGIFDIYKPIPGSIEAVHYNNGGNGIGYYDISQGNSSGKYIRKDNVDIRDCTEGGHAITASQASEWYKYNVNVKVSGRYNVGIRYLTSLTTSKIRIWQGETDLTGIVNLPITEGFENWRTFTIKGLLLTQGYQTLRIETVSGDLDFYKMQFAQADNSIVSKSDAYGIVYSADWNYSDGVWTIESGQANINGSGKRTMGSVGWSDYTIQTDVVYNDLINAGIIFRVNNPALGGAGNDPVLGTDFYQGYYVSLNPKSIVLGKQNFNWVQLATSVGTYNLNTKYTIKVVASGANIKVYVTDMTIPKIDFTDPNPFINGKVGLRSFNAHVHFDNFTVSTAYNEIPTKLVNPFFDINTVDIFPNPVREFLSINHIEIFSDISIYNVNGQELYNTKLTEPKWTMNMTKFKDGIYFVKLRNKFGFTITKKIVKY